MFRLLQSQCTDLCVSGVVALPKLGQPPLRFRTRKVCCLMSHTLLTATAGTIPRKVLTSTIKTFNHYATRTGESAVPGKGGNG